MPRTLLIGNHGSTWREWVKENRDGRPFLCLDPSDPQQSIPGQLCCFQGSKPLSSRFYGSLDAQRAPHVMVSTVAQAIEAFPDDLIVQLFPYRSMPLLRQATILISQLLRPTEILIAEGTEIDQAGFPVGPSEVVLDKSYPPLVQLAQRKALWLRMFESCVNHTIDLRKVSIEGVRLGTGIRLTNDERRATESPIETFGLCGAIRRDFIRGFRHGYRRVRCGGRTRFHWLHASPLCSSRYVP